MWKGNLIIENEEVYVEAYEYISGRFKEWKGSGRISGKGNVDTGTHDTDLGRIIVNYINPLSGEFTFIGSGAPLVKL